MGFLALLALLALEYAFHLLCFSFLHIFCLFPFSVSGAESGRALALIAPIAAAHCFLPFLSSSLSAFPACCIFFFFLLSIV